MRALALALFVVACSDPAADYPTPPPPASWQGDKIVGLWCVYSPCTEPGSCQCVGESPAEKLANAKRCDVLMAPTVDKAEFARLKKDYSFKTSIDIKDPEKYEGALDAIDTAEKPILITSSDPDTTKLIAALWKLRHGSFGFETDEIYAELMRRGFHPKPNLWAIWQDKSGWKKRETPPRADKLPTYVGGFACPKFDVKTWTASRPPGVVP